MASKERFISPGVFTQENDLSFLPQGIAEIGGAFIGGATSGPAFVPTIVESQDEFEDIFGTPVPDYYLGHAVQNYLKEAARATVVRILGIGGYANASGVVMYVSGTHKDGTGVKYPIAFLHPSRAGVSITTASLAASGAGEFTITVTGSGTNATASYTSLSLDSASSNYFVETFGTDPKSTEPAYALYSFPRAKDLLLSGSSTTGDLSKDPYIIIESGSTADSILNFSGSTNGEYDGAETPWIQSQKVGNKKWNLFKIHTIADGTNSNTSVKICIANTRPAPSTADDKHGKFSIIVRTYTDTDNKPSILEQFDNLSMDPDSADYVARRIGDQYWSVNTTTGDLTLEGDYPSISRYIYIEPTTEPENLPETVLPAGFNAPLYPIQITSGVTAISASYVMSRYSVPTGTSESIANDNVYYGWKFENDPTNESLLAPIPGPVAATTVAPTFSLLDLTGSDIGVAQAVHSGTIADAKLRKFGVPLQKGFDGLNPARYMYVDNDITTTNTQGFNLQLSSTDDSKAFKLAIDILNDPEAWDINLLVIPGVLRQYHSYIVAEAIDMCEERADCFYIMDGFAFNSTVSSTISTVSSLDTNYAGVYHPWVKMFDSNTNKNLWVPPSVLLPRVYAFNDRAAAEWFAPAGLNRGGIPGAVQVEKRLKKEDRDDLYDNRINPIAMFPGQGIVAWGQKTLQLKSSALDRINVRRLLIALKKFIASSSRYLVFEQNTDATRQRFLNIVNPYLASVQERSGLYAFKVIMDESNNTPDIIDRNILVGEIYLQPTKTAEFISLQFNVLPTGAEFPEGG